MMVSGSLPGGRSTMKSSTTTPSPFSTISTALMSPPTPPMADATAPSCPGRSGRRTRIRNTGPSLYIGVTEGFRPGVGASRVSRDRSAIVVRVPAFRPFRALRYAVDDLADLVAPPYDVLSEAEVHALADRSPHNIVRVDVPLHGDDRYTRSAALLQRWQDEGVLVRDDEAGFTVYRMRFTDATGAARDLAGVLGGLEVVDEGAGGVLPHERTTPKASTDRLGLARGTRPNLPPVWGLSLARGLTELLREPGEPLGSVQDGGVQHSVERVRDPERVAAIAAVVAADDVLIADGHHRYAVSRTYRDEVRAATGSSDTTAELTMTYVAELVEDQLSIDPIHRVYRGVTADALLEQLGRYCTTSEAGPVTPRFAVEAIDRGA